MAHAEKWGIPNSTALRSSAANRFWLTIPTAEKRAGEMCQIFCDHWGYAENDINYKSMAEILGDLVDCRGYNCNYLLNVGPKGNGSLRDFDRCCLEAIGKWIKKNKNFIYDVKRADTEAENAIMFKGADGKLYAAVKNVPMSGNANVQAESECVKVTLKGDVKVKSARLLDNGKKIKAKGNTIFVPPFSYGDSLIVRVAEIDLQQP